MIAVSTVAASLSLANYPRTQPFTHYDGQERISGFLDEEYTGQMKGEGTPYNDSVPNKWTYEYVDSAKQLGVYRFFDVCNQVSPVDDWERPYYIQPVRLLDSKPGSRSESEYWNPFFQTIVTCPFEEIVLHSSLETVTSASFIVHATHEVYNSVVNHDPSYAMTSEGLFVDIASGGYLHDSDDFRAHFAATTYYYPFIKYVGPYCFASNSALTMVTVPEGVTHIEEGAFLDCQNLTSATLPTTLEYIGEAAFSGCEALMAFSVETNNPTFKVVDGVLFSKDGKRLVAFPPGKGGNYTLPADVETIDDHAFDSCTNTVVELPWENSLELAWWKPNPFADCAQVRIVVPEGVEYLNGCYDIRYCTHVVLPSTWVANPPNYGMPGGFQFQSSEALVSLEVASNNPYFKSVDGALFSKDGRKLAVFPTCRSGAYAVPEGVTSIGLGAFSFSDLESVSLPASLQSIEEVSTTFGNMSNIKSLSVDSGNTVFASLDGVLFSADYGNLIFYPGNRDGATYSVTNSVLSIGQYAFCRSSNLETVIIPDSVESIAVGAFELCYRLGSIQVSQANLWYKDINGVLFTKDGDTLLCCPEGKTGAYIIPEGVRDIGDGAFNSSHLGSVTIPSGVATIGDYAFRYCGALTTLSIPEGVTRIGEGAFEDCSGLTTLTIPEGVTRIGEGAFGYCSGLTALTIPDSVYDIGRYCFFGCDSISRLQLPYAFKNVLDDIDLCIPASCEVVFGDRVPLATVAVESPVVMEDVYTNVWLGVTGGTGPYTLSIDGSIPDGMWYDDECSIAGWINVKGSPYENSAGTNTFTVTVTDADGATAEREFTLVVAENPNHRPVFESWTPEIFNLRIDPGASRTFTVAASDPDGDDVSFRWLIWTYDSNWEYLREIDGGNESSFTLSTSEGEDGCTYQIRSIISDGQREDCIDWFVHVAPHVPLEVATSLPPAVVGQTYEATLSATGGTAPYSWSFSFYEMSRTANSFAETGSAQDWSDDDSCWRVGLPFSFPFYGQTYDQIWVSDNGTICLDGVFSEYSFDENDFTSHALIAPLWRDFNGGEQTIYMDSTITGQVTIRWNSRVYDSDVSDPDVCFSATLCEDGSIRFSYGATCASGNIGISGGDGASFQLPDGIQSVDMSGANDVVFTPKPFASGVELALDGTVSGTPTITGRYRVSASVKDDEGTMWSGVVELVVLPDANYTMTTPEPVPFSFITSRSPGSLAVANGDYEAAAKATAANGVNKVWECYVAGLDPTNMTARFEATITMDANGKPHVAWNPPLPAAEAAKREYRILGAKSLGGEWDDVTDMADPDAKGYRFFKAKVRMGD